MNTAPNLIKTSITTKVLVLTSDITAKYTVKITITKIEFYFGLFLHYLCFLGNFSCDSSHLVFYLKARFPVKLQC